LGGEARSVTGGKNLEENAEDVLNC